jgi:hypothetical protein
MQQFLSNGGLSKMLWIILVFLLGLASIIMLFIEIINNQPVNPYILSMVAGVAAHGFTIGGSINTSTQLESNSEKTGVLISAQGSTGQPPAGS